MGSKILKFVIGLILIPVAIGVTIAFFKCLAPLGPTRHTGARLFMWGVFSYALMHLFLFKLNYIYTFGHEITHVLATWICGGAVKSFNVSSKSGSVETTKTNSFINLSPYFIPTYTLILSLLYVVLPYFIKIPYLKTAYFFSAGFTLMLHLVFTAEVLKVKQPDVIRTGYLFSIVIIYLINILLVALILSLLFEGMTFDRFYSIAYRASKDMYIYLYKWIF